MSKIKEGEKQRSLAQNRAIHKVFRDLADELNSRGLTLRAVLEILGNLEVPCTTENMKEIFRSIMKAEIKKQSTTELNTKEVDQIFDTFHREVLVPLKVDMPFPSIEELMYKQKGYIRIIKK